MLGQKKKCLKKAYTLTEKIKNKNKKRTTGFMQ